MIEIQMIYILFDGSQITYVKIVIKPNVYCIVY